MQKTSRKTAVRRAIAIALAATIPLTGILAAAPAGAAGRVITLRDVNVRALTVPLLAGGLIVTNASFRGNDVQMGAYAGLDIGQERLRHGLALSTGSLIDADPNSDADVDFTSSALLGPNDKLTTTGDFGGEGDEALTEVAGTSTYDTATLTLTVLPLTRKIEISYLVGSEEYAGWSERGYHDAVAVWVNGELCSTLPSGEPTGVGTIGPGVNADLYNNNMDGQNPGTQFDTEFNGFTDQLTCSAEVTRFKRSTVTFAVGDTQDGHLDTTLLISTRLSRGTLR
ncbi:choice-of-anchor L domain-containing protein [Microbacterium sp. CPCC 204701]|uniref:choice-of-anchor L domain-containing protein n=1 Tax=Microbacterium sp. CPCC 204701 TaxID=2493084 RepID=UPI000FDA7AD3|nr:choice-of-anchor L domain-containing protein [Microbacterium sp. CPCC 204701]